MTDRPDFVVIGLVRNAHGTRGEVCVEPISDIAERFDRLERVLVRDRSGIRDVEVTSRRRKGGLVLLKLTGIDDRTAAQALARAELGVRGQDVWPLPEDTYYIFDLVGARVIGDGGREVGVVEDVLRMPANDVFVVRTAKGEALIPVTRNVVKQIDLRDKTIVIEEIEGLLD